MVIGGCGVVVLVVVDSLLRCSISVLLGFYLFGRLVLIR